MDFEEIILARLRFKPASTAHRTAAEAQSKRGENMAISTGSARELRAAAAGELGFSLRGLRDSAHVHGSSARRLIPYFYWFLMIF